MHERNYKRCLLLEVTEATGFVYRQFIKIYTNGNSVRYSFKYLHHECIVLVLSRVTGKLSKGIKVNSFKGVLSVLLDADDYGKDTSFYVELLKGY